MSGGQKSIVALVFLFAVQRCDPAPFYIFDEADAALDEGRRERVIRWIAEQKNRSQFLCTTFRKEFLAKADTLWGVKCLNNVSHISELTLEEAQDFIEALGEDSVDDAEAETSESM